MSDTDEAYVEAQRLIAEAKREGASFLSFNTSATRALTFFPPELAELRKLRTLSFSDTAITDSGMARLKGPIRVQRLDLRNV